jgi:pilus assembly protein Flp/PilA
LVIPFGLEEEGVSPMKTIIKKLVGDNRGATAIEYGLIAAIIALGIITAAGNVGTKLAAKFQSVATALT